MSIFSHFPKTKVDIVSPSGELRCSTQGIMTDGQIQIADTSIEVEPGDEVRSLLPSGKEDVFVVQDATYNQGLRPIPPFYTLKLSRKGAFPQHTGGHYINVSGNNSRVNLGSVDNSVNIYSEGVPFSDLRAAIQAGVEDANERQVLLDAVERLSNSPDTKTRGQAYQTLMANAANHMAVIAPFLTMLAQFVTGGSA